MKGKIESLFIYRKRVVAKLFTMAMKMILHSVGSKTSIYPPLRYSNLNLVRVGFGTTIHSNCWIQVIDEDSDSDEPKLIIGDYVGIGMNSTISAAKKITICDYVFTARNVYISDHGHRYQDITMPISQQGIDNQKEVVIRENTWIGQNAVILPGVVIGRHCIIGANSVVTKSVPDYSIVAGVPAKVIRRYNRETSNWERSA